jgi:hypothetical protein
LVVTETQASGAIATWVFKPSTQNTYNQVLAQWQGQLRADYVQAQAAAEAARQAGPCQVRVDGHDALIVFSGGARHDWCNGVLQATKYHYLPVSIPIGQRELVCQTDLTNAHVEVYDSGGHIIGSDACAVLKRMHASNGPTDWLTWNAAQAVVDSLEKTKSTTAALKKATDFGSILATYARDWQSMQDKWAKEQADAKKTPLTCGQKGIVEGDAGIVSGARGIVEGAHGVFEAKQQSVAGARTDLVGASGALDAAIKASPAAAVQDAQSVSDAAHQQLDASDAAVQDAKSKVSAFDDEAKALDQTATAFAKGLACQN